RSWWAARPAWRAPRRGRGRGRAATRAASWAGGRARRRASAPRGALPPAGRPAWGRWASGARWGWPGGRPAWCGPGRRRAPSGFFWTTRPRPARPVDHAADPGAGLGLGQGLEHVAPPQEVGVLVGEGEDVAVLRGRVRHQERLELRPSLAPHRVPREGAALLGAGRGVDGRSVGGRGVGRRRAGGRAPRRAVRLEGWHLVVGLG